MEISSTGIHKSHFSKTPFVWIERRPFSNKSHFTVFEKKTFKIEFQICLWIHQLVNLSSLQECIFESKCTINKIYTKIYLKQPYKMILRGNNIIFLILSFFKNTFCKLKSLESFNNTHIFNFKILQQYILSKSEQKVKNSDCNKFHKGS